jgi:hypothetical protein
MKHFILFLTLVTTQFSAFSAGVGPNFAPIAAALNSGNADALGKYFDSEVELTIFEKADSYRKDQAVGVMRDFFSKNKPKSFNQLHQGASKGKDSQYSIGEIATATGNYRIYLYMKVVNDSYIIQEIRIGKN